MEEKNVRNRETSEVNSGSNSAVGARLGRVLRSDENALLRTISANRGDLYSGETHLQPMVRFGGYEKRRGGRLF